MGESPKRRPIRPSMPSAKRSAPTSIKRIVVLCTGGASVAGVAGQDGSDAVQTFAGADGDDDVVRLETEGRAGGGDHLAVAQDGHDGRAGAGAGAGVTQAAADERRAGGQGDLLGEQTRGLLPQTGELAEH